MRNVLKAGVVAGIAAAVLGSAGVGTASATPPVAHPEPGGVIRMDLAPGEWWSCIGYSLQPPFVQQAPGYYQYGLGPNPIYFKFTPGADVWINCTGTGVPFIYYGPIVKAG